MQVESLGKCYHASINGLESQRCVCCEQFSHPPIVMRSHLYDPEFVIGDRGAEFRSQAGVPAPLWIG